jgi:hypothetical protein
LPAARGLPKRSVPIGVLRSCLTGPSAFAGLPRRKTVTKIAATALSPKRGQSCEPSQAAISPARNYAPRQNRLYFRERSAGGLRIRLKGEFGSPEFMPQYEAAARTEAARSEVSKPSGRAKEAQGSLAWLIAQYRQSAVWAALSPATRRQRERIFRRVIESAGTLAYASINRAEKCYT